MQKWGLVFMLLAILGLPVLACGFPLPVSDPTAAEMAPMEAVCAADEAPESCEMRQNAYALMADLQSGSVTDMAISLESQSEGETTDMAVTGSYDFVANDAEGGIGMDLSVMIDTGQITSADGTDDLSGASLMIIGDQVYSLEAGQDQWEVESLTDDQDSLLGLAFLLGLGGGQFDFFADPTVFSVEMGDDVEMDGQMMHVQTLTVDLGALLMNPDALSALMASGEETGGDALGGDTSGEDMIGLAPMMLGFMGDTEFSSTLYIGADDGYIHRVEDNYVFNMDLSAFDPESQPVSMVYTLEGNIVNHNGAIEVVAPEGAVEGSNLFGGVDLGGVLGGE